MGGTLPDLDQPAPAFELPGVTPGGNSREGFIETRLGLGDFAGRWLILYFYPKDFTSGCTLEARGFQQDLGAFHNRQAEVVGVSADDAEAHISFCGSEGLAFPLLSDPGGAVSRAYGSWIAPFSQRHTFLIDPEGILRARWSAVRPSGHSQEVLSELARLQTLATG
jgi:peroxiredoxin Q/BCP